jgi:hypothetical protein
VIGEFENLAGVRVETRQRRRIPCKQRRCLLCVGQANIRRCSRYHFLDSIVLGTVCIDLLTRKELLEWFSAASVVAPFPILCQPRQEDSIDLVAKTMHICRVTMALVDPTLLKCVSNLAYAT